MVLLQILYFSLRNYKTRLHTFVFMFRRFKHKTFSCLVFAQCGVNVSRLQSSAWKEISEKYRHIMIYPNTAEIYSNKDGFKIQVFAQENNMTMNIVYLARNVSEEVNKDVYSYFDEMRDGKKPEQWEDTCYIFFDILPF